jgi:hypothetical protein
MSEVENYKGSIDQQRQKWEKGIDKYLDLKAVLDQEVEEALGIVGGDDRAVNHDDLLAMRMATADDFFISESVDELVIELGKYRMYLMSRGDEEREAALSRLMLDYLYPLEDYRANRDYVWDFDIPEELQNIEIPRGYVILYTRVPLEALDSIIENGLDVSWNKRKTGKNSELEKIFSESAREHNLEKYDRTQVIFAELDREGINVGMALKKRNAHVLQIAVDPRDLIVVDGDEYTFASQELSRGMPGKIKKIADDYWDGAKPLKEILELRYVGEITPGDMENLEVLIPYNIPVSRITLVK